MTNIELDCRRLLCPMPVIRVQDRVAGLNKGDILKAVCSDPGALLDIPAWCRINGHEVVETRSVDGDHLVTLKVGDTRRRAFTTGEQDIRDINNPQPFNTS